jgi:hypothetical protein
MPEGYYSGDEPNPFIREFIDSFAGTFDPETDAYETPAFNRPLSTTKATAIYNMHVYWSKKSHEAIREYIRHYTRPDDVVLDPFCGSGGTAVAALMEGRKAVAIDRSPAATFLTKNYCTLVDPDALLSALDKVKRKVEPEIRWLYETRCDRCGGRAMTGYTVYSHVFRCSRCLAEVPLFDCSEVERDPGARRPQTIKVCPHCFPAHVEAIDARSENRTGIIPVLVTYQCEGGCKPKRGERRHNDEDANKRSYFEEYDLGKLAEIEAKSNPYWYPTTRMMNAPVGQQRWGVLWRPYLRGISRVCDFYSKRNLWAMSAIRQAIMEEPDNQLRDALLFGLTGIALNSTKMYRERQSGRGIASGIYFIPPLSREMVVTNGFYYKVEQQLVAGYAALREIEAPDVIISTQSACDLHPIPSNSIDYIFTDPPYSWKVQYGEANFVWEAWLGLNTNWHDEEMIVNAVRGRNEGKWAAMMREAIAECYRVLKPGRWLSLCYHDTSEGTWQLIQDVMAEAGFVVDKSDSALFIDSEQKSWKQTVSDKITKRDLVLNFRKPSQSDAVVQVLIPADADVATFAELGQEVVRDYLTAHPGATKDRIYDHLVSRMVRKQQMESHDFDELLRGVAEEVREPVKKNLFENEEPDLFGRHVRSRWYLKETADHIDQAEQEKEDAAAARLEAFMQEYMKERFDVEGVHYSDLFEEYLPVPDKPRRLLADWLPEYFYKTTSGTWRPPKDEEERQQKVALRERGTLRRVKRFANALIDGVPVRDKDRPANDADLADWIQQCRRAGLYEQGRALYEKGGLNFDKLDEVEQLEVEDAYRICVRRGTEEEKKPKRKGRKK